MLHIVVWNGVVTHVYRLNDNPNKPDFCLEEEFDYKVEYNASGVTPETVECEEGEDGWLIPKLRREA